MLLFLLFLYSFFFTLVLPALFPTLKLAYFAPFLIFTFYHSSKSKSIWLALLCGLIFDLLSAQMRFGIYALNYTATTCLLLTIKKYFFEDHLSTLPIMTLIFIYTSAFLQLILTDILTNDSILSWNWFKVELMEIPFYTLIYTIIAFAFLPFFFPSKLKKTPTLVKFKN